MTTKAIHAIIHGRVQGVFFRDNTLAKATELKISGWVRNNVDGTVELEAIGDAESVERFERWINQGPPLARVDNVQQRLLDPKAVEYSRFTITN